MFSSPHDEPFRVTKQGVSPADSRSEPPATVYLVCWCGNNPNLASPVGARFTLEEAEQLVAERAQMLREDAAAQIIKKELDRLEDPPMPLPHYEYGLPPKTGKNRRDWCYWQIFELPVP